MADGPSVENDIWRHYQTNFPGQVQVLGPDLWNGTAPQLNTFRNATGATYPLLLNGASGAGNENLLVPYGQFDNYVVVNKQGIIRYHAYDRWPHGNRYHLNEIRACVDSLITMGTTDVGDPSPRGLELSAAPNPFSRTTTLELANPGTAPVNARVAVHDVSGRRVALLWDAPLAAGRTRIEWDGRTGGGATMAPGIYLVAAEVGGTRLTRRIVRVR